MMEQPLSYPNSSVCKHYVFSKAVSIVTLAGAQCFWRFSRSFPRIIHFPGSILPNAVRKYFFRCYSKRKESGF